MSYDRSGEDSPQDYDDAEDRLKQEVTDLKTEIERLRTVLLEIKAGEEMTGADAMAIATRALQ